MWEDPIVAEVHRARQKLAADCNYDIRAFFEGLRKRQALEQKRVEKSAEAELGHPSDSSDSTSSETARQLS